MKKIFGLYLRGEILAVMEINTFLSKSKEDLEALCYALLPDYIEFELELWADYKHNFDISSMHYQITGDNGSVFIEFKELDIIQ